MEGEIQDRVKSLRRVKAADLRRSGKNWRTHPNEQQKALESSLGTIGFAGAVVAREDEDGKLVIIDGHLRADVSDDQKVPVLLVDLTEQEADALLATTDGIGAMAGTNTDALMELLREAQHNFPDLDAVNSIADHFGITDSGDLGDDEPPPIGELEYRILVECDGEAHQAKALAKLTKEGLKCRALIS